MATVSGDVVPSLWTLGAEPVEAPKIEYAELSPTLIVLGAAVVGILLEAFLPRRLRYGSQLIVAGLGLASAFAAVLGLAISGHATTKAAVAGMGAIAVDGPTLFLQGTILLVGMLS